VTISGGGATTDATATVYGGVDAVTVADPGFGYTFPTVEFSLPNDPNGTQVQGHAEMDASGVITAVIVDNAGSGYSSAPNVTIHDGSISDPILGATLATATATLAIQSVVLDTFGSGYVSAPTVTFSDTGSGIHYNHQPDQWWLRLHDPWYQEVYRSTAWSLYASCMSHKW
jgi:hypothetical protein